MADASLPVPPTAPILGAAPHKTLLVSKPAPPVWASRKSGTQCGLDAHIAAQAPTEGDAGKASTDAAAIAGVPAAARARAPAASGRWAEELRAGLLGF
eukprot:CAMPEP_0171073726 /NCGR_PEP_ID=MMETSP0766_2-20121228/11689_1 /TAXON_ID=439317 /ORGANISM="Gambierdiscus australes, Strain CAWD 149" /LENGTH=97 /DNA_ID=CAMNT_0011530445 /DNA_START=77 /DNA_END=369 /DNA_ORIENTATION=-